MAIGDRPLDSDELGNKGEKALNNSVSTLN